MSNAVNMTQHEFLTFMLGGQLCGVPVIQVNDVLTLQGITRAPLSPPAVEGFMNLRGKIVTAVDVRRCLGEPACEKGGKRMSIVVEDHGEMFSLIIDSIGDVLRLDNSSLDEIPVTLTGKWREVISSIYKLEKQLLVILDISTLLEKARQKPAIRLEA